MGCRKPGRWNEEVTVLESWGCPLHFVEAEATNGEAVVVEKYWGQEV